MSKVTLVICSAAYFICAIVLCVMILVLTYFKSKSDSCINNERFWCHKGFGCPTICETTLDPGKNKCYYSKTGDLHSCLFGPSSDLAKRCWHLDKGALGCQCDYNPTDPSKSTCLAGCAKNLNSITGTCCCDPKSKNCKNTVSDPRCTQK